MEQALEGRQTQSWSRNSDADREAEEGGPAIDETRREINVVENTLFHFVGLRM